MVDFIKSHRRHACGRRRWRLRLSVAAALVAAAGITAEAATLTLACLPVGQAVAQCKAAAETWSETSGHEVRVVTAAGEGREALEAYESLLSIESPRLDVISFPEKWGPTLAPHLIDLAAAPSAIAPGTLDVAAALGRFGVKQIGAPHHLAIGVLYFRSDLVAEPPATWQALGAEVDRVNGAAPDRRLEGLIFPSIPAGDIVATMLEWIASYGAAPIVGDGTRAAAQPETVRSALAVVDGWVGNVIPPETARFDRTQAYTAFRDGRTVFMRHWSYVYPELVDSLAQAGQESGAPPIVAGMSTLPRAEVEDGVSRGALLVWLLGVSRHSNHQEAAKELVAHLTSEPAQRAAAIEHGLAPTIASLYADEDVLAARDWLAVVGAALETAIVPPVAAFGANHLEAIDAIGAIARDMITSGLSAEDATRAVDRVIARIRRGGTN